MSARYVGEKLGSIEDGYDTRRTVQHVGEDFVVIALDDPDGNHGDMPAVYALTAGVGGGSVRFAYASVEEAIANAREDIERQFSNKKLTGQVVH